MEKIFLAILSLIPLNHHPTLHHLISLQDQIPLLQSLDHTKITCTKQFTTPSAIYQTKITNNTYVGLLCNRPRNVDPIYGTSDSNILMIIFVLVFCSIYTYQHKPKLNTVEQMARTVLLEPTQ